MDDAKLEKVAEGRGLYWPAGGRVEAVDQLGDEKAAVAWLVAERRSRATCRYATTSQPALRRPDVPGTAASITLDALGLGTVARQIEQAGVAQAVDQLRLDGMLALWRPAASN